MVEQPVMLITGSRKGIGRALAERYVERGYLVEGCSRDQPDWELDGYRHHRADVTQETEVRTMFSSIRKTHGRLDVLINNAGVASMNHTLLTPMDSARRIMEINFLGSFVVARDAAKLMQRRRYGRIVNMVTIAAPLNLEGEAIYAASKSAVESLTRIMARELGESGITVNAIGPTPIDTDLIRGVPQAKMDALIARLAIKRFGTFDDVANVVDFFIRPESDFITGQIIYLGGV